MKISPEVVSKFLKEIEHSPEKHKGIAQWFKGLPVNHDAVKRGVKKADPTPIVIAETWGS